jgi:Flp pilus assembly pilin Flp
MAALRTLLVRLAKEESGAEVIEYALVLGMIAVGTILGMKVMGIKVATRWTTIAGADW